MKTTAHSGHRGRMAERFASAGFDGWQPHEILERLLFGIVPRRDTNELSHRLLAAFGSLRGVLTASLETLESVPGVGPSSAALLSSILPGFIDALTASFREKGKAGEAGLLLLADLHLRFRECPGLLVLFDGDGGFLDAVSVPLPADLPDRIGEAARLLLIFEEDIVSPVLLHFLLAALRPGHPPVFLRYLTEDCRLTEETEI